MAAAPQPGEVEISDNRQESRYEVRVGGELAGFSEYLRQGDRITFMHTEIVPEFEGRGIGTALIVAELDEARQAKLNVVPRCPFVRAYVTRHPAYLDILEPEWRERIEREMKSSQ